MSESKWLMVFVAIKASADHVCAICKAICESVAEIKAQKEGES